MRLQLKNDSRIIFVLILLYFAEQLGDPAVGIMGEAQAGDEQQRTAADHINPFVVGVCNVFGCSFIQYQPVRLLSAGKAIRGQQIGLADGVTLTPQFKGNNSSDARAC